MATLSFLVGVLRVDVTTFLSMSCLEQNQPFQEGTKHQKAHFQGSKHAYFPIQNVMYVYNALLFN
ncbi:MAG: hypothetical protein BGO59_28620 [Spirosoma sp. 48-14]|nr:MAG: hypothetical protein BGO59_28620 [Spirosoma sp. 48-14]